MEAAQKWIATTRGTTLLAILAAVLAGILILVYVGRYRDSVKSQGAPVTVLVASTKILKGTPGSVVAAKGMFTATTIRQGQLLDGAISDPSSLTGHAASTTIYRGQQLTSADFAASATTIASTLSDRQRVVTVPIDPAHGVLNYLQAGDHVDIFAGFNVVPISSDGTPLAGGAGRPVVRLAMQDIEVVGTGEGKGGIGGGGSSVSLRVNDVQAAKLAYIADNGKLWFALRPASGAKPSRPEIQTAETVILGLRPVVLLRALGGH